MTIRIVRKETGSAIQDAIDTRENETTRDFFSFDAKYPNLEMKEHDRGEYKQFKVKSDIMDKQAVYYCVNCGRFLTEEKAQQHDRIHKMGGFIA